MTSTSFLAKLGAAAVVVAAPATLFLGAGSAQAFEWHWAGLESGDSTVARNYSATADQLGRPDRSGLVRRRRGAASKLGSVTTPGVWT